MAERRQFCTFMLGEHFFGVEVTRVQEVLRYQEMTRIPLAAETLPGLINLRGQIVTAVDLRSRMDMEPFAPDATPMNVVIKTGDGMISLLVDEIRDVHEMDEERFERVPETVSGVARELLEGAYKLDGSLLLILDVDRTLQFEAQDA